MAYEHDIFLSYEHESSEWIRDVFLPDFRKYFRQELDHDPEIFFDRDGILAGDAWPDRLKRALACSKCMITVLMPSYFRSQWCLNEINVMLYREKQLGYRTIDNPSGLIFPVRLHDGERFPDYIKDIQFFDCKNYWRSPVVLKKTERYLEFQDALLSWLEKVALIVQNPPQWNSGWLSQDWIETPLINIPKPVPVSYTPPFL